MSKLINLIGQTFNRLTVINRTKNSKSGQTKWKCQCKCGNITIVSGSDLRIGHTKSCGCFRIECTIKKNLTHGMRHSSEYGAWNNMITRCYDPSNKGFKHYGGRGIKVCKEWRKSFSNFYKHIGNKPSPEYSIERINNNGNYAFGNVKWATRIEQANNNRHNHFIIINGWNFTIAQWARFVGSNPLIICSRIHRGWPPTKAIFQPIKHQRSSSIWISTP